MNPVESIQPYLEPIRKSVTVQRSVEDTFEIFTSGIASWWPTAGFSVSGERTAEVRLEGSVGGGLFEVRDDGERFPWGRVLVWEPPGCVAFSWHPGRDPDTAQEVEIRFRAAEGGTRVELEHRGWERLGTLAKSTRDGYVGGWDVVFVDEFARACG